jgi:hypothetical protein
MYKAGQVRGSLSGITCSRSARFPQSLSVSCSGNLPPPPGVAADDLKIVIIIGIDLRQLLRLAPARRAILLPWVFGGGAPARLIGNARRK